MPPPELRSRRGLAAERPTLRLTEALLSPRGKGTAERTPPTAATLTAALARMAG